MTNQTIEWFQTTQRASEESLRRNKKQLEEEKQRIENWEERNKFRQKQIDEAIKQGKETFDDTKFLIKKKLNHTRKLRKTNKLTRRLKNDTRQA